MLRDRSLEHERQMSALARELHMSTEERKAAEAETQRMAAIEAENEVLAQNYLEDERTGLTSPTDMDL